MIVDNNLYFSDAQVITASVTPSTNYLDVTQGSPQTTLFNGAALPGRNLGSGERVRIVITFTALVGASNWQAVWQADPTSSAFGAAVSLESTPNALTAVVVNTQAIMEPNVAKPYKFFRILWNWSTATSYTVTASLVINAQTTLMSQSY